MDYCVVPKDNTERISTIDCTANTNKNMLFRHDIRKPGGLMMQCVTWPRHWFLALSSTLIATESELYKPALINHSERCRFLSPRWLMSITVATVNEWCLHCSQGNWHFHQTLLCDTVWSQLNWNWSCSVLLGVQHIKDFRGGDSLLAMFFTSQPAEKYFLPDLCFQFALS